MFRLKVVSPFQWQHLVHVAVQVQKHWWSLRCSQWVTDLWLVNGWIGCYLSCWKQPLAFATLNRIKLCSLKMMQDTYKKPAGYTQCVEIWSAEVSSDKRQRLVCPSCAAKQSVWSVKLRSPTVQELCTAVELRLTKLSLFGTEWGVPALIDADRSALNPTCLMSHQEKSRWEIQLESSKQDQLARAEVTELYWWGCSLGCSHLECAALALGEYCQNSCLTWVLLISKDFFKYCWSWQWLN